MNAQVSTTTPQPNCDYIGKGSILTQDYILRNVDETVNTIAGICNPGESTVLEITVGSGQ